MTFQNVTAFKDYAKKINCFYYGVIAYALKFWNEYLKPSDSSYF